MIRAAACAAALAALLAGPAAAEDAPSSGRTWAPVELVHPEVGRKLQAPAPRDAAPRPAPPASPSPEPEARRPPAPAAASAPPRDATVAFAPGSSDIGAGLAAQLEPIAAQLAGAQARVRIDAYAGAGAADPQRLALRRGLALRGFLIARGVPASNIEMRAQAAAGDGDPDRAELRVGR